MIPITYANKNQSTHIREVQGVPYLTFRSLERPELVHGFSTRLGGVSEGYLGTMNLSFHRGDRREAVLENHRRFAQAVGYDETRLVFSDQVHETHIHKVTESDCGKGICRDSDILEIDGLVTDFSASSEELLASISGVMEAINEVSKAAEVAKKAGLKHHVKIISKQEFWDALPDVMYHMDEPLGDASAVALYFLSKEAAGHVKVVLSGEGADELFGGYNIYREPESLKKIAWIPFGVRRVIGKLAAKLPDVKGRDFLIRAGMKVEERFIGNAYIYREKEKTQILKNKVTGPSTQEYLRPFFEELESENRGSLQDMEKMQSVDLSYWLPGDILQKADKMSMAHSLEVRVPFLDKEVFDFAAKLPKEAKIAAGTTKYIFRKAVSEFLPQETDERKKLAFPIPIRVWLRQDDWYQMVTGLFTSKEAEEFFHTDKLLLLLKEHKEKKADNSRKIWTVLTFLIWYDRFFATCSK